MAVKHNKFLEIANKITEYFVFNSTVKNKVLEMFLSVGEQAFVNQQNSMINRKECMSILSQINCPSLVIHASQDKNFSLEMHQELVEKIPNAKLAIVEDSGHMSAVEMPQAITSLLRFWLMYF